ncbi:MAG: epoxide hydrolase [Treponema sp.]|nr:epoxide hydrolase [Treponema sp.]
MTDFSIRFPDEALSELRRRIAETRFPNLPNGAGWSLGTDGGYLRSLLAYWRDTYDWRKKERELNAYPQFTCDIGGVTVHFFHIRSAHTGALPLLLTHGWPDSFLRYAKIFPLLSDYDLIVPSLPGFAFSSLPQKGFMSNAETAERWHILMTEKLGYTEYAASGGDMGRGVTCYLAANHPNEVRGIHLTDVGLVRSLISASNETLTPAELDYKRRANDWLAHEGAYISLHSTKPHSLAYALSDSPAGMAAWITEKYRAWSDWELLTMDDLCDCLTLYWLTNSAATSILAYHANSFTLPPLGNITAPTAIAAFPHDVLPAPREWIEAHYPLVQYTHMPRGGHFTALEQPAPFAESVRQFMRAIR